MFNLSIRTAVMDDAISHRLSGLSKRQLLAALEAVTEKCGSTACNALTSFLDTIPPPPGSSRAAPVAQEATETVEASTEPAAASAGSAFTLEKYRTRQIALQVQYDGTAYLGFASQDLEQTIENHLFNALIKLKLIEDRKTCQYSRCGRTDKGVSALGQVISVNVRSAIPKDLPEHLMQCLKHPSDKVIIENAPTAASPVPSAAADGTSADGAANVTATAAGSKASKKSKNKGGANTNNAPTHKTITEMDYVTMLNRSLPEDIRVLGWCAVTDEFSARFSASHRKYRYFFLRGSLDIAAMQQAAASLVGEHDFRNICKIDIGNVTNFRREIYSAEIKLFQRGSVDPVLDGADTLGSSSDGDNSNAIYMLEIKGIAFLWHMVRCIMSLLFMVGQRLEGPTIVTQLLDIENCKGKPPYPMAPEQPLVLHECGFDNLHIRMQARHLWQLTAHYRGILEGHLISAARARNSLELLLQSSVRQADAADFVRTLRDKETVHSKRLSDKGVSQQQGKSVVSAVAVAAVAATAAAVVDTVGQEGISSGSSGSKRKLAEILSDNSSAGDSNLHSASTTSAAAVVDSAVQVEGEQQDEQVSWSALLQHMESEYSLVPKVKYIPHVPLMQRKKEDSYEQKVSNLAGNKKERLERHVTLSSAAAESGATPSFFQKMRQQGSL